MPLLTITSGVNLARLCWLDLCEVVQDRPLERDAHGLALTKNLDQTGRLKLFNVCDIVPADIGWASRINLP